MQRTINFLSLANNFYVFSIVCFRGYCENCAQQLTLCPVCRQLIDRFQESIPTTATPIVLVS